MRALFEADSHVLEDTERLCSRLSVMREQPGQPIVSVIDYSYGSPLADISTLEKEREDGDICWDEHIARAERSRGVHGTASHARLGWEANAPLDVFAAL